MAKHLAPRLGQGGLSVVVFAQPNSLPKIMEALLTSIGAVTLGEIGDKTQLLALMLAARFKRPYLIVLGILTATLANHILAGLVGSWIRDTLPPEVLRWLLASAFIIMGLWILKPDKIDSDEFNDR